MYTAKDHLWCYKVFNPKLLPAAKGGIETMLTQIQELQQLLVEMKFKSKFGLK